MPFAILGSSEGSQDGSCVKIQQLEFPAVVAPIARDLRWQIWERDNFTCRICGARQFLVVDHVVPRWHGGPTIPGNLQTLCQSCNSRKGTRVPDRDFNDDQHERKGARDGHWRPYGWHIAKMLVSNRSPEQIRARFPDVSLASIADVQENIRRYRNLKNDWYEKVARLRPRVSRQRVMQLVHRARERGLIAESKLSPVEDSPHT